MGTVSKPSSVNKFFLETILIDYKIINSTHPQHKIIFSNQIYHHKLSKTWIFYCNGYSNITITYHSQALQMS